MQELILAGAVVTTAAITYAAAARSYDPPDFLGWFVVVGFFGIIVLLALRPLPEGANEAVLILVGQASGGFAAVIGFRYGTTQGSARKDATIMTLAAQPQSPSAPGVDTAVKPG